MREESVNNVTKQNFVAEHLKSLLEHCTSELMGYQDQLDENYQRVMDIECRIQEIEVKIKQIHHAIETLKKSECIT